MTDKYDMPVVMRYIPPPPTTPPKRHHRIQPVTIAVRAFCLRPLVSQRCTIVQECLGSYLIPSDSALFVLATLTQPVFLVRSSSSSCMIFRANANLR